MRTSPIFLALACVSCVAHAAAPRTIPIQGRLTKSTGEALPDGPRGVTFRLYDSDSGGTMLWSESQTVQVADGHFSTALGSVTPFPDTMLFSIPYHLGITVAGEAEMSPRLPLQTVPYAMSLSLPSRAATLSSETALSIHNAGSGTAISATRTSSGGALGAITGSSASVTPYAVGILGELTTTSAGGYSAAVKGYNHSTTTSGIGVWGHQDGGGWGVLGDSPSGAGAFGSSISGSGILGQSTTSYGGQFSSASGTGVRVSSSTGTGAYISSAGSQPGVEINQTGTGTGLQVRTTDGLAGSFVANGSGYGIDAMSYHSNGVNGTSNDLASAGVYGSNMMGGAGVFGSTTSYSGYAGVTGINYGSGNGVFGSSFTGAGGRFEVSSVDSSSNALEARAAGSGNGLYVSYMGGGTSTTTNRNLAVFRSGIYTKARIDNTGKGYFDGGTQNSGADVAEAFAVKGGRRSYEPGDVLVISATSDRTLEKSSEAYATTIAGVYSTRPGTLLTEGHANADLSDMVPLGVIGVIPTKVTTENGPIRRGDLLVTSSTPGHAMKAGRNPPAGSVIGKALAEFDGEGAGLIRVLVNVR